MESPPPGWYPDPQAADQQRYWDGTQWTDQFAPKAPTPAMSGRNLMILGWALSLLGAISLVSALGTTSSSGAFKGGALMIPVLLLLAGPVVVLNGWRRSRAAPK